MIHLSRRVVLTGSLLLTLPGLVQAAAFPEKPVKMVIGYSAGSSTDTIGRLVAQGLSNLWKQPVVVENRAGAAGNIAADHVAKSPADGYTLLFAQNGLAISVASRKLPFDGRKDLLPVAGVTATPHLLIVKDSLPVKDVQSLIELARQQQGKLNFSSAGIGNSDHMAGELFKALTGIQAQHIPYKSGMSAATDLVGGSIDFYFSGMPVGLPLYKSGRVRALAVTSAQRYADAPEIPTMQEAGVKDYEMALWQGVFLARDTPPEVAKAIGDSVLELLRDPEVQKSLTGAGAQLAPLPAEAFSKLYLSDIDRWTRIIADAGITLE